MSHEHDASEHLTAGAARVSELSEGMLVEGKYRIIGKLGEGAMGVVYRATHLGLDHPVALKVLRPELCEQAEVAARFAREARMVARLDSQHVVKLLDFGHLERGGRFMVMEYLEGEDLLSRIERSGPVRLADAIRIGLEAATGLWEAHRYGIVHRDLKPENLYLARTQQGTEIVKLLDFGVCKTTGETPSKLTRPRVALGSPYYMSPEQLMAQGDVDARADVWSLGVVLYEITTGRMPFHGASLAEVYARVLRSEPAPPSRYNPELPPAFDRLVLSCLRKNPGERPQSMSELADALATCTDVRASAPNSAPPPPAEQALPEANKKGTTDWNAVTLRGPAARASAALQHRRGTSLIALLVLASLGLLSIRSGPPTPASLEGQVTDRNHARAGEALEPSMQSSRPDVPARPLTSSADPARPSTEPARAPAAASGMLDAGLARTPAAGPRAAFANRPSTAKPRRKPARAPLPLAQPSWLHESGVSDFGGRR